MYIAQLLFVRAVYFFSYYVQCVLLMYVKLPLNKKAISFL